MPQNSVLPARLEQTKLVGLLCIVSGSMDTSNVQAIDSGGMNVDIPRWQYVLVKLI